MDPLYDDGTIESIRGLKDDAAFLAELLALDSRPQVDAWKQAVDNRLLPRMMPGFPLTVAWYVFSTPNLGCVSRWQRSPSLVIRSAPSVSMSSLPTG